MWSGLFDGGGDGLILQLLLGKGDREWVEKTVRFKGSVGEKERERDMEKFDWFFFCSFLFIF